MKREAELKAAFTQEMAKQLPTYLMLLQATAGAADRAIVGCSKTTWWEFKHGTPNFELPSNQALMCARLAFQGYCRYVVWEENKKGLKRTLIVHPRQMITEGANGVAYISSGYLYEAMCIGFNHRWLCNYIRSVHENHQR
jgi:hypothetical protein